MTTGSHRSAGVPPRTMAALMFAVFTVSVGYGVVLPLLPYRIERLIGTGSEAAQVYRNVGLVTGIYTLAMFLFAPIWGRTSDRRGRRAVLLAGLIGLGAVMMIFSSVETLWAVYAERFLSGMFAAAVTPVASAAIGDLAATEEARARRLTFVSLAGVSGFLLGPMLGVYLDADRASLGVAVGSVVGGLLFDVARLPGASFLLTTGLATIGFILSLKLPRVLGACMVGTEHTAVSTLIPRSF